MKHWFSLACILLVALCLSSCSMIPFEDTSDMDLTQEEIDSVQDTTPAAIATPKKRNIRRFRSIRSIPSMKNLCRFLFLYTIMK